MKGLLWRLVERPLLPDFLNLFVEHIYKCFLSVLSSARRPRTWSSPEENLPSFLAVACHQHWIVRGQLIAGVMFGELSDWLFVNLGVCMGGWEWMCE